MYRKSILSFLALTAAVMTFGLSEANAGFPAPPGVPGILIPPGLPGSSVNVRIDGYLPAPPGVNVQIDSGRPYYVERDRRVYIERERPRHYKKRHYKKEKRRHEDNGNHYGEEKHGGRGGHGR